MFGFVFWLIVTILVFVVLRRLSRLLRDRPRVWAQRIEAMQQQGATPGQINAAQERQDQAQTIADIGRYGYWAVQTGVVLVLLWQFVSLSLFYVPEYNTGHVVQRFGGPSLTTGKIIAVHGENGPQARVYGPGWKWVTGIRLYSNVDTDLPAVDIPAGHFGEVIALDGEPLPEDAVIASPLPGTSIAPDAPAEKPKQTEESSGDVHSAVFDAEYFLTHEGQKGLQSTVLKPGLHRLNLYLFNVRVTFENGVSWLYDKTGKHIYQPKDTKQMSWEPTSVTTVKTGYVGVIKSNMVEGWRNGDACKYKAQKKDLGQLRAVLVPDGCKGVWTTAFEPGAYFFNPAVYEVTQIPTRAIRWTYKGGYKKCQIDLTVKPDGSFNQERSCENEQYDPETYADRAIFVKVEGWNIPVELRVLVQVKPEDAPAVVAAVGSVEEMENRIVTPSIRSVVRNIGGGSYEAPMYDDDGQLIKDANGQIKIGLRPARALDFQDHREYLEKAFDKAIKAEAAKAGITVLEVKIGEPAIPPELLVSRRREQLAQQLERAFDQEQQAQGVRIKAEQAKATADQQATLVESQIENKRSEQLRQARHNAGLGEQDYLEAVAKGQSAQAKVLGEDRVMIIQIVKDVLSTIERQPEIMKALPNPQTVILGGNSLDSASTILSKAFSTSKEK